MGEPRRFALNPMDNIMPRFNINFVLTFGLKPGVPFQQVHDLLQASLQSAADELPIFRRRVFAVPAAHDQTNQTTAGRLEAREHPDWTPQVVFNDLSESWPDYQDLLDEGLPQDELDGAQLLPPAPTDLDPEGEGAAAIVAQANFVHGGLLLAACHFHSLVDGMSGSLLLKMWAKHMRIHQGVDERMARLDIPPSNCDYDLVPRAWQDAGNKVPPPHEVQKASPETWRLLGLLPPLFPEEMAAKRAFSLDPTAAPPPPEMQTSVFYVSASAFAALTAAAAPPKADSESTVVPTANDALMALLWRCVMRARLAADPASPAYAAPGALAELDTTLDGRALFSDALPWAYMGTLIFIATTRMAVASVVAPSHRIPLSTIAAEVRRSVKSITRERLHEAYGLAAAMDGAELASAGLRYPFATFAGAESCFTSFLSMPVMDASLGSGVFVNGGTPDYMRPPRREFDVVCRRCVILPPRPAGGFEILLSLKKGEMEALERDEEFAEFAQFLCH
ncbi:hypothetical protein B0T25DRAFT_301441 [Lasiosphaeria hispida]|uniref:Uncharacterized protein n=1 Tax=Lasiosphaeria hispida TaxID=260671 RepID=A0AAJ0M954_9PEZI|nr:hypothetical protein B0T25DRAFT_301441 [Lasiosphaeria hispida]